MTLQQLTQESLDHIARAGIGVDTAALRQDMSAQFEDPYECFRELVVNASDAGATEVTLDFRAVDEEHFYLEIRDDGHGMDRAALVGMFTLFRSQKRPASGRATVGQHGVGVKSLPAAGQVSMAVLTSTGEQAHEARAGSLLSSAPIRIREVSPAGNPGTRFAIRFARKEPLERVVNQVVGVLRRYCARLPLRIRVLREGVLVEAPFGMQPWFDVATLAQRRFTFPVGGGECDVIVELTDAPHELYQGRVMISQKYNVLSHGHTPALSIPGLRLRVDCSSFELPFGRHGLRNEDVLAPIGEILRTEILPDYVSGLCDAYRADSLEEQGVLPEHVEALCVELLGADLLWAKLLRQMPLFLDVEAERHSLWDLATALRGNGALYVEGEDQTGIDYDVFPKPVLSCRQSKVALDFLGAHFGTGLVHLATTNLVMEAPSGQGRPLTDKERRFERHLRVHPGLNSGVLPEALMEDAAKKAEPSVRTQRLQTTTKKKTKEALDTLDGMRWRVAYLVERDGKTPCLQQRLLLKGEDEVVLNLHHPDVAALLELSKRDPLLAGHLGLCMAVTEPTGGFMGHVSPGTKDKLLLADAMARATGPEAFEQASEDDRVTKSVKAFRDLQGLLSGGRRSSGGRHNAKLPRGTRGGNSNNGGYRAD